MVLEIEVPDDNEAAELSAEFERNPPMCRPRSIYVKLIQGFGLPNTGDKKPLYWATFGIGKEMYQTDKVENRRGCPIWDSFATFDVKSALEILKIKIMRDGDLLRKLNIAVWDLPQSGGEEISIELPAAKGMLGAGATQGSIKIEAHFVASENFDENQGEEREKLVKNFMKMCNKSRDILLLSQGALLRRNGSSQQSMGSYASYGSFDGDNKSVISTGSTVLDPETQYHMADLGVFDHVCMNGTEQDVRMAMQELVLISRNLEQRYEYYMGYTEQLLARIMTHAPELVTMAMQKQPKKIDADDFIKRSSDPAAS